MNIFVLFILGYLLYRFIGGFLIPLFRTTSHMRQQFQNMNKQPGQEGHNSNPPSPAGAGFGGQSSKRSTVNPTSPDGAGFGGHSGQHNSDNSGASKVGEYIDFEEIK